MPSSGEDDSAREHAAAQKLQGIVRARRAKHMFNGAVARASLANAEATVMKCQRGFEFRLDLSTKMGMVINTDGELSKITEGGQAESAGLRIGCRVIEADGVSISSLAELKASLAACRDGGRVDCLLKYSDPRLLKKALADVARLRAQILRAEALMAATELVKPFLDSRPNAEGVLESAAESPENVVAEMKRPDADASCTAENVVGDAVVDNLRHEKMALEPAVHSSPLDASSTKSTDAATKPSILDASSTGDIGAVDTDYAQESSIAVEAEQPKTGVPSTGEEGGIAGSSRDTVDVSSTYAAEAPLEESKFFKESNEPTSESTPSSNDNGVPEDCTPSYSAVGEAPTGEMDINAINTEDKVELPTSPLENVGASSPHAAEVSVEKPAIDVIDNLPSNESTPSDNKTGRAVNYAPEKPAVEEVPAEKGNADETSSLDVGNAHSSQAMIPQNESNNFAEGLTTEHDVAAIKVQGLRRKHVAKNRVGALREESKREALQQDVAATKLQGLSRKRTAKSRAQTIRNERRARSEDDAALKIQSISRSRASRVKVKAVRKEKKEARIRQSLEAEAAEREAAADKTRIEDHAAMKVQGLLRQRTARLRVQARREHALEQKNSALKIQSMSRRRSSKAKVQAMRTENEARVHAGEEKARSEADAALKIQSMSRCRSSKARVQTKRVENEEARMRQSLKVQAELDAAEEKARNDDDAAIKMQSLARQRKARQRVQARREDAAQREVSALKIQSMSRRRASKLEVDAMRTESEARLAANAEREAFERAEEAAHQERIVKAAMKAAKSEAKMQAACEADLVDRLDAQLLVDNTRLLDQRAYLEAAKREAQKQQLHQLKAQQDSSNSSSSLSQPAPLSLLPAAAKPPSNSFVLSPLIKTSPHNRHNLVQVCVFSCKYSIERS